MRSTTASLWATQDRHAGDRQRLFGAVAAAIDVHRVLYPGSYVDVAPSFVWPDVTYVDVDRRAARFFSDDDGVAELIASIGGEAAAAHRFGFLHADYTGNLAIEPESIDLLISLYAGPVSLHCTHHLGVGGWLLANPSHGDVALASIDHRYELGAVITSRDGSYSVSSASLDGYLIPKRPVDITVASILEAGRGVAYTRSPFAYLFRRIR